MLVAHAREVAEDVLVVPDRGVGLVPNIGVIGGEDAVLVVDTGLGPGNAEEVLRFAADRAAGRRLYLTTTHAHPEHASGASAFAGRATYLAAAAQAEDLAAQGAVALQAMAAMGDVVAGHLDGARVVAPEVTFDGAHDLDLGGRVVQLRATGRAHSRGDQVVVVPDAGVLFTGDLVEAGQFAILPWFPPHATDATGTGWIAVMERLLAEDHRVVVPGHGEVGGPQLLTDVRDHLRDLRDETWRRLDAGMPEEAVVAEVTAVLTARHPDWTGQEWIAPGVLCLAAERAA